MRRWLVACCLTSACAPALELESHEAALVDGTALCRNQLPAVVPWLSADPLGGYRHDGLICSATLIAPQVAITAAHCVEGANDDGIDVDGTLIGLDMIDAVARDGTTVVVRQAKVLAWDVALLKLETAVDDRPIIPLGRQWVPVQKSKAIIVGFGGTSRPGGEIPERGPKKFMEATLVSRVSHGLLFGSSEGSVSHGDSGGPTLVQLDGRVYLISIHSALLDKFTGDALVIAPETLAEIETAFADWGLSLPANDGGDDVARFEPCDPASNDRDQSGCSTAGSPSPPTMLGTIATLAWMAWRSRRRAGATVGP